MPEEKQKKQVKIVNKEDQKTEDKPIDKEKAKKAKEDIDKLIDEIDDILEKNSDEFIKSYVQKGGE